VQREGIRRRAGSVVSIPTNKALQLHPDAEKLEEGQPETKKKKIEPHIDSDSTRKKRERGIRSLARDASFEALVEETARLKIILCAFRSTVGMDEHENTTI